MLLPKPLQHGDTSLLNWMYTQLQSLKLNIKKREFFNAVHKYKRIRYKGDILPPILADFLTREIKNAIIQAILFNA